MAKINVPSGLTAEYIGVHLVRLTFADGVLTGVDLMEDLTIELDALGNVTAHSTNVTLAPVVAAVSAVIEAPSFTAG